ncbi:hypothetical protein [Caldalkalibacillus salinus]|uniref:hypothetical protein n=1 Tax=Caldalkalibacillus salinus TaxID=2803787 RepID=UPI0019240E8A|nr:hypothetical protein [Caldalkalibacillus salinus]
MICQACKLNNVQVVEENEQDNQPYELCNGCYDRLTKRALRPIEWYNLAVIHSSNKFYLHDDFYDEDGTATQPEEDVIINDEHLAPELNDVANDLDKLLDYSMTSWWLNDDTIKVLNSHDKQMVYDQVKSRYALTNNVEIRSRILQIVEKVLTTVAEKWIRRLWEERLTIENNLLDLAMASAVSLPFVEGFKNVKHHLQNISPQKLPHAAFGCLHKFRSPLVLDWMEDKVTSPVNEAWGRLAALSRPTWHKLAHWLSLGRPMSLVALDTLVKCIGKPNDPYLRKFSPKLERYASVNEMESVLDQYLLIDNVHRVRRDIMVIKENWNDILGINN